MSLMINQDPVIYCFMYQEVKNRTNWKTQKNKANFRSVEA